MPTMISNESANTMNWGEAILYCDSLNESGFSDWIMPTSDQLLYAISGGCVIPDSRTQTHVWTRSIYPGQSFSMYRISLLMLNAGNQSGIANTTNYPSVQQYTKCRCVR